MHEAAMKELQDFEFTWKPFFEPKDDHRFRNRARVQDPNYVGEAEFTIVEEREERLLNP